MGIEDAKKRLDALNAAGAPEWVVLRYDEATGRALVLSKDVVALRAYHAPEEVTWETSHLRKWLNDEYFAALPEPVKSRVVETEIENPYSNAIPGGNNTLDKVFLLSIDEYYEMPEELRAAKYGDAPAWWWLRSPGYSTGDVADVYPDGGLDGGIGAHGFYAFCESGGVRPAMYLDLKEGR